MPLLVIDDVGKRYGHNRWALRGISLSLERGVLGLVGPNGAGKTTLLRILATLLRPTQGGITWNGEDIVQRPQPFRRTLGYLPQDFGVHPELTAREFLQYVGELKGMNGVLLKQRIEVVLETVRLQDDADRRLRVFSGGMIRRIGIAQALLSEPYLLLLDEPTVGLDPAERIQFRETLASLGEKRLVVLSTHIISDVEAMATKLALLQKGHLTWAGTPEELLVAAEGRVWTVTVTTSEFEHLRATYRVSAAVQRTEGVHLRLIAPIRPHPVAVPATPTLEDAYLLFVEEINTINTLT